MLGSYSNQSKNVVSTLVRSVEELKRLNYDLHERSERLARINSGSQHCMEMLSARLHHFSARFSARSNKLKIFQEQKAVNEQLANEEKAAKDLAAQCEDKLKLEIARIDVVLSHLVIVESTLGLGFYQEERKLDEQLQKVSQGRAELEKLEEKSQKSLLLQTALVKLKSERDGLEETCQELIKRVLAEKERKRREQEINEQIQLDIINEHKRKYEGEKLGLDQAVIAARQWQDRKNLLEQFMSELDLAAETIEKYQSTAKSFHNNELKSRLRNASSELASKKNLHFETSRKLEGKQQERVALLAQVKENCKQQEIYRREIIVQRESLLHKIDSVSAKLTSVTFKRHSCQIIAQEVESEYKHIADSQRQFQDQSCKAERDKLKKELDIRRQVANEHRARLTALTLDQDQLKQRRLDACRALDSMNEQWKLEKQEVQRSSLELESNQQKLKTLKASVQMHRNEAADWENKILMMAQEQADANKLIADAEIKKADAEKEAASAAEAAKKKEKDEFDKHLEATEKLWHADISAKTKELDGVKEELARKAAEEELKFGELEKKRVASAKVEEAEVQAEQQVETEICKVIAPNVEAIIEIPGSPFDPRTRRMRAAAIETMPLVSVKVNSPAAPMPAKFKEVESISHVEMFTTGRKKRFAVVKREEVQAQAQAKHRAKKDQTSEASRAGQAQRSEEEALHVLDGSSCLTEEPVEECPSDRVRMRRAKREDAQLQAKLKESVEKVQAPAKIKPLAVETGAQAQLKQFPREVQTTQEAVSFDLQAAETRQLKLSLESRAQQLADAEGRAKKQYLKMDHMVQASKMKSSRHDQARKAKNTKAEINRNSNSHQLSNTLHLDRVAARSASDSDGSATPVPEKKPIRKKRRNIRVPISSEEEVTPQRRNPASKSRIPKRLNNSTVLNKFHESNPVCKMRLKSTSSKKNCVSSKIASDSDSVMELRIRHGPPSKLHPVHVATPRPNSSVHVGTPTITTVNRSELARSKNNIDIGSKTGGTKSNPSTGHVNKSPVASIANFDASIETPRSPFDPRSRVRGAKLPTTSSVPFPINTPAAPMSAPLVRSRRKAIYSPGLSILGIASSLKRSLASLDWDIDQPANLFNENDNPGSGLNESGSILKRCKLSQQQAAPSPTNTVQNTPRSSTQRKPMNSISSSAANSRLPQAPDKSLSKILPDAASGTSTPLVKAPPKRFLAPAPSKSVLDANTTNIVRSKRLKPNNHSRIDSNALSPPVVGTLLATPPTQSWFDSSF